MMDDSSNMEEIELRTGQVTDKYQRPEVPEPFLARTKRRLQNVPGLGIWCSVISNTFFAFNIVTTKAIVKDNNVLLVGTIQSVVKLLLVLPVIIRYQLPILGVQGERWYLIGFSISTALFQLGRTYAYAFISASDASAIIMAYPIMVTIIAPFILKETFRKIYVFNAILSITGIFLVVRPPFIFGGDNQPTNQNHLAGITLSLACIFVMTAYCIFIRHLRKTSSCVSCACSSTVSLLCFGVPCLFKAQFTLPECGADSVLLVLSAALHVADMLMYYIAYKFEEAGPLSVVGTIEIPLILLLEMALLGTIPNLTTFLGAFLVLCGVFLTALCKWTRFWKLIETSRVRFYNKFHFA